MNSTSYETMPLAIVGMACRFAGGVDSPEKLWDFVSRGQDAWSTIPATRFNVDAFYHRHADKAATTNIRGGYFLQEDVGLFDPSFFGLSADMAAAMDPQIRMLLELAFESLESAGVSLQEISGSKTSVFTGTFVKDYHEELLSDPLRLPRHLILGNYAAMAANRISYFLNLKGPSAAVDTGCSTSTVGLHLACQSLRTGESDYAIVGGANVLLGPDSFVNLSNLGSCGAEGKCFSFDHRAEGYGRGEGAAILLVKRLDDALRNHDPVRALIRETAVNQDGRTATIAAPDENAQYDLIRTCYERARLNPLDTLVVEAHGTGTKVGDPIEARTIGRAFRPRVQTGAVRPEGRAPIYLASVKTNIGHTEAASGVAAIIKMVKSLETREIAPSINFEKANPDIDMDGLGLEVVTELRSWPKDQVCRASVNNYGYGGTNSHVILESAPRAAETCCSTKTATATAQKIPRLFVLSARTEATLRRVASDLCSHLEQDDYDRYSLESLAYTLGQRRSRFPWTVTLSAHSVRGLAESLAQEDHVRPVQVPSREPRIGFVFNGQGAQWFGMGRQLMDAYPTYIKTLEECDAAVMRCGADWSLVEELKRSQEESRVDQVQFSMPLTCAIQLGLIRLLGEWGVQPAAVVGHSTGEVAAAFAAGALSLDEAMAVTFFRGLLNARHLEQEASRGLSGLGGMMAVGLGPSEVWPYVQDRPASKRPGTVSVACYNSPSSTTLSGDMAVIDELKQVFDDKHIFTRKLKVQAAFHSHHMNHLAGAYRTALDEHMSSDDRSFTHSVQFFSTCTGALIEDAHQLGPSYWVSNMLEPVRFTQAFGNMVLAVDTNAEGSQTLSNVDVLVELGAHGALAAPIRQLLSQSPMKNLGIVYGSCLDRGKDAVKTTQNLAGRLVQHGCPVDMARVNFGTADGDFAGLTVIPDLPSYPWNHTTSFWAEPRPSRAHRFRKHAPHELIGSRIPIVSDQSPVWRNVLRCSDQPWLRDHVVQCQVVFPGAGYVTMAIEAMRQECAGESAGDAAGCQKVVRGYRLRDVELCRAVIVPRDPVTAEEGVEVQISLDLPDERVLVPDWRRFRICAASDRTSPWELVAHGLISVEWGSTSSTSEGATSQTSGPTVPRRSDKHDFALRSTAETVGAVPPHPSRYRRKLKPEDLFKTLRGNGICHGPRFRNLSGDIRLGEGRCLTTITVADTDANGSGAHPVALVHPVTLDSVCVGAYACRHASGGSLKEATTAVPKSIKGLYVSSKLAGGAGSRLEAHFATRYYSKAGFGVSAAVYNSELPGQEAGPVLEIEDLRCQDVGVAGQTPRGDGEGEGEGEGEGQGALKSKDQLCLVTEWKRSFGLNDSAPLAQSLSLQAAALPEVQNQVEAEKALHRDLERAAFYCISDALRGLSDGDISKLQWHHKRLHDWMLLLERRAAGNELGPRSSRWSSSSEGARQMLVDKVENASITGALAMRIGKNLLPVLRGHTAPLELMLKDKLLYSFYQDCLHFPRATKHAASLVLSMAEENPRLRILEIGAGTGGCTLPVLQALGGGGGGSNSPPLFEHYTFTDISAGFFEVARQKLATWDGSVSYASLNIEQDTAEQGFQAGSFDVVIAAQVLHATKNITNTLKNVRGLLKDGGKLVLVETIRDTTYLHMIFGTLPGWWLSEEPERQYNPNMPVDSWDKTLRETGFTGVEVNAWDCEDPEHRALACIVSSAVGPRAPPLLLRETAALLYDGQDAAPVGWLRTLADRFSRELNVALSVEPLSPAFVPDGKLCLFVSGVGGRAQRWPWDAAAFASVKTLVTRSKCVLWITTGSAVECEIPENALHQGLLRTARLEDTSRRFVSLDLDPFSPPWAQTEFVLKVFRATMSDPTAANLDFEYAVRRSELLVPRVCPDAREHDELMSGLSEGKPDMQPFSAADRGLRMVVDTPGLVDSITFREDPNAGLPLPDDWVEVEPRAYGLNFHDVMTVMGMLRQDVQEIGSECAGVVTRVGRRSSDHNGQDHSGPLRVGDRVCGLLAHGHFANHVRVPWTWMVRIPASMPFETAASFPLVFVTAYHSLFDAGRCAPEDTVLIHAASGGVGQACIILARWKGVPVENLLVTAGTPEKRDFLRAEYGLPPGNIFSSRDEAFVEGVLAATGRRGVDVVINSLSGRLLHETIRLVAPLGRFVEIGKRDIDANKSLEMEPFQKAISFSHVDVIQLCDRKGALVQRVLQEVVSLVAGEAIRNVTPVTTTPLGDIVRTFRTMQTGKHIGKLVLAVAPDEVVKITSPPKTARLRPDVTYMIVGGTSGIGLSVANYFLDRGARTLLLVSRNAVRRSDTPTFRDLQEKAVLRGARLVVRDLDVGQPDAVRSLTKHCRDSGLPDIRGVVHGGMVLDDAIIEHMTFAQWRRALVPKLDGTRNITDALGDGLDFFVALSSLCGVWGNPSQANYAAGSAYQDAVARHRGGRGLPAVALDLGAVGSVGYVADARDGDVGERLLRNSGHRPLTEAEALALVDYAVRRPRRAARVSQIASGMSGAGTYALHDPRFSIMVRRALDTGRPGAGPRAGGAGTPASGLVMSIHERISTAASPGEAADRVRSALVARISDMFAIPETDIDPRKPLAHFGVDSLVAVELRNWIVPNARVELTIFELLKSPSLAELAAKVVKLARPVF